MNEKEQLQHMSIITGALILLAYLVNHHQGKVKWMAGSRAPEDHKITNRDQNFRSDNKSEAELRIERSILNNLENIPFFFLITFLLGPTFGVNKELHVVCGYVFLVCRIIYSYCFQYAIQPWRSIVYTLGITVALILLFANIIATF